MAFSNKNFGDLDSFKSYEIAKNSIIRQNSRNWIIKNFKELKIDEKYYQNLIKNYYDNLGLNSYDEFLKYVKKKCRYQYHKTKNNNWGIVE